MLNYQHTLMTFRDR